MSLNARVPHTTYRYRQPVVIAEPDAAEDRLVAAEKHALAVLAVEQGQGTALPEPADGRIELGDGRVLFVTASAKCGFVYEGLGGSRMTRDKVLEALRGDEARA